MCLGVGINFKKVLYLVAFFFFYSWEETFEIKHCFASAQARNKNRNHGRTRRIVVVAGWVRNLI